MTAMNIRDTDQTHAVGSLDRFETLHCESAPLDCVKLSDVHLISATGAQEVLHQPLYILVADLKNHCFGLDDFVEVRGRTTSHVERSNTKVLLMDELHSFEVVYSSDERARQL